MKSNSFNDSEKIEIFNIEIDYMIISSLKRVYELVLESNKRLKSIHNNNYINVKEMNILKIKMDSYIKLIIKDGKLNIQKNNNSSKILPFDYPIRTLHTIKEILLNNEKKWELFKLNKSSIQYIDKNIKGRYKKISSDILVEHFKLQSNLEAIDTKDKKFIDKINLLFSKKEKKLLDAIKTLNYYIRELKSNSNLTIIRLVSLDKENPFINRWLNYRFINFYIDSLSKELIKSTKQKQYLQAVKALHYNIKKARGKLQNSDGWILWGNYFNDYINNSRIRDLEDLKYLIMDKRDYRKKNMLSKIKKQVDLETIYKNNEENVDNAYKIVREKAIMIYDFLESYDINRLFKKEVPLSEKEVLELLDIEELDIEVGDRLNLELCETLDVIYTEDIEKEYIINKIYIKGLKLDNKILRKSAVSVYRYKI